MHFFVDESGPFELGAPLARYSCVGVLVVPTAQLDAVLGCAQNFKTRHSVHGELKGSKLTDDQVVDLVWNLRQFDILFEVAVFCSELHDTARLTAYQQASAAGCTKYVTRDHPTSIVMDLVAMERGIAELPPKWFVQSAVTAEVLTSVIARAPLYYVQRTPSELGSFIWEFDPKDSTTPKNPFGGYDRLMDAVIRPWVQFKSPSEPATMLQGADYSHFAPFMESMPETPDYLVPLFGMHRPFEYNSVTKMLKSRSFPDSRDSLGLQLADALTNLTKRSLNGNLGDSASCTLGCLMLEHPKRPTVKLIALGEGSAGSLKDDFQARRFVIHCDRIAKRMIPRKTPAPRTEADHP